MGKIDPQRNTEKLRNMDPHQVPSALTTLGAKLATALEKECRSRGQLNNMPFWAKLETGMRSYYAHKKAYMPDQMILCRMLETFQIDDADHDTLIVNTFSNMKWSGDNKQHEWLVTWHELFGSLMKVLQRCLNQSNRKRHAVIYWEFLEKGQPPEVIRLAIQPDPGEHGEGSG